jgi:hypothetical protein
MGFTKVTELPLLLHPVEPDPFLDSISGELRSGMPSSPPDCTTTLLSDTCAVSPQMSVFSPGG